MGSKSKNSVSPETKTADAEDKAKAAVGDDAEETAVKGTPEEGAGAAEGTDEGAAEGAGDAGEGGEGAGAEEGNTTGAEDEKGSDDTPPPPPDAEVKEVVKPQPHHIAFFEQFVELTKNKRADQAIKAFNNSLKSMFDANSDAAFNGVYKMFVSSGDVITVSTALQSAATLPHSDRAVVEVVFTVFHILKTGQKDASVNLDLVRTLTKNEKFVVWCTKKLQK